MVSCVCGLERKIEFETEFLSSIKLIIVLHANEFEIN